MGTATLVCAAMALWGLDAEASIPTDRVDLVEVNHFFDDQGQPVLHQVIFYDWCGSQNRFNVRDFRLLKSPSQLPRRDWRTESYVALWHDNGVLRRVRARSFRESWTRYDPELLERNFLPKERRRELTKLPRKIDLAVDGTE